MLLAGCSGRVGWGPCSAKEGVVVKGQRRATHDMSDPSVSRFAHSSRSMLTEFSCRLSEATRPHGQYLIVAVLRRGSSGACSIRPPSLVRNPSTTGQSEEGHWINDQHQGFISPPK